MKRFLITTACSAALLAMLGASAAHAVYYTPSAGSYSSRYNSRYPYGSTYGPSYGYSLYQPYMYNDRSYQYVPNTARVIREDDSTRTVIRMYFDRNGRPLYDKVSTTSTRVVPHTQSAYTPSRGYINAYDPYADPYDSYNTYNYNPWMYPSYNSYNPSMYQQPYNNPSMYPSYGSYNNSWMNSYSSWGY